MDPNMSPESMAAMQQLLMSDPEVTSMLTPDMVTKLMSIQGNPSLAATYAQADPQFQRLLAKLLPIMQKAQSPSFANNNNNNNNNNNSLPNGTVIQITSSAQFQKILDEAGDKLVAVDFYTTWCGPCKRISPVFEMRAKEYAQIAIFTKVDGDKNRELVDQYSVSAYPTFLFFVNGRQVESLKGADEARLTNIINQYSQVQPKQKVNPYKHFPLADNEIVKYDTIKWEAVVSKLQENNAKLSSEAASSSSSSSSSPSGVLSASELSSVQSLIVSLQTKIDYHSVTFSPLQFSLVERLVTLWPMDMLGAPLHVLRMLVLHPNAAQHYAKLLTATASNSNSSSSSSSGQTDFVERLLTVMSKGQKTQALLVLWTLSNLFFRHVLRTSVAHRYEDVFEVVSTVLNKYDDEQVQLAGVGVFINYAIAFRAVSGDHFQAAKTQLLSSCLDLVPLSSSSVVCYRALLILGTLVYEDEPIQDMARSLEGQERAASASTRHSSDPKVVEVAREFQDAIAEKKK